jgi:hypothetical protein
MAQQTIVRMMAVLIAWKRLVRRNAILLFKVAILSINAIPVLVCLVSAEGGRLFVS